MIRCAAQMMRGLVWSAPMPSDPQPTDAPDEEEATDDLPNLPEDIKEWIDRETACVLSTLLSPGILLVLSSISGLFDLLTMALL